jgi:hypothetical protein
MRVAAPRARSAEPPPGPTAASRRDDALTQTRPPAMKIAFKPLTVDIEAPPGLLYQMLSALGHGPIRPGERVEVRSREADRVVADFWTRVPLPLGRAAVVRTREEVIFHPPDRVEYCHLDGPLRRLAEQITAEAVLAHPRHTRLVYQAEMPDAGLARYLLLRLVGQPLLRRTMRAHFGDLKLRAEARARRSRVFAEEVVEPPVRT